MYSYIFLHIFVYPYYLDIEVFEELPNPMLITSSASRWHRFSCTLYLNARCRLFPSPTRTCCRIRLALCTWNSSSWKEKVLPLPFETNQQLLPVRTALNSLQSIFFISVDIRNMLSYKSELTEVLNMPIIAGKVWTPLKKIRRISLKATSDSRFPTSL